MIDIRTLNTLVLTPAEHPFFDSIVVVLSSAAGLRQAFVAELEGSVPRWDPRTPGVFEGMPHVTNVRQFFLPSELLVPLARNSWPEKINVYEQPLSASVGPRPPDAPQQYPSARGFTGVTDTVMRSAFISYYEAAEPDVRFGMDASKWPSVWRFGRVVRNALTHNGRIDIRNPRAAPESWRSLTYAPADNGKQILFRDFALPELLHLLIDLAAAAK